MNGVIQMFNWPTVQMLIGLWTKLHAGGTSIVVSLQKTWRGQNGMFPGLFRCNTISRDVFVQIRLHAVNVYSFTSGRNEESRGFWLACINARSMQPTCWTLIIIEFFTGSLQYKNANIANFVSAMPLDQWSLEAWNVMLICQLISNFTFIKPFWCKQRKKLHGNTKLAILPKIADFMHLWKPRLCFWMPLQGMKIPKIWKINFAIIQTFANNAALLSKAKNRCKL